MAYDTKEMKEFLETAPLYYPMEFTLPDALERLLPAVLHLPCCVGEKQPYKNAASAVITDIGVTRYTTQSNIPGSGYAPHHWPIISPGVYSIVYRCQGCASEFHCLLLIRFKDNLVGPQAIVQKAGQIPAFDIRVPSSVKKHLSAEAVTFYSRAQIAISHSFGIAACVYLRRVMSDEITPLLETNYQIKKQENADEKELKRFEEAIAAKTFDEKIRLISQDLPDSIEVPGNNPVLLAYRQLSNGLHNLSDKECVDVAKRVSGILIHLLVGLRDEQENKKQYLANIKALAKEPATRESS